MVISPRADELKVLAVRLTEAGTKEITQYVEEFRKKNVDTENQGNEEEYVKSQINASSTKFYYQVPFSLSQDQCVVIDLREKEQVLQRLKEFVAAGKSDYFWLERHSRHS